MMTAKGIIDAYLERLGSRMHKATGVRLSNYVSTDLHEVTMFREGITKWQLMLWLSKEPLPSKAKDWLAMEVTANQIRRRQEMQDLFVIVTSRSRI